MIKVINDKGDKLEFNGTLGILTRKKIVEIIEISDKLQFLYCSNNLLTSLPSKLPTELIDLYCRYNNIQKLPDLRPCTKLEFVNCDLVCFEPYMLEMDINIEFYY